MAGGRRLRDESDSRRTPKAALLSRDGMDDRRLNPRPDRAILRDTDGGERELLERKPAREGRSSDQYHGACVLVTGSDFAERCGHRYVNGPFAKFGEAAGNEVAPPMA